MSRSDRTCYLFSCLKQVPCLCQSFPKLVKFFLERSVIFFLSCLLNLRLDLAYLCAHPSLIYDAEARSIGDRCSRKHHAVFALQLAVLIFHWVCAFQHSYRFSCQRCLLCSQSCCAQLDDTDVSRNLVPNLEQYQVTRNKFSGRQVRYLDSRPTLN